MSCLNITVFRHEVLCSNPTVITDIHRQGRISWCLKALGERDSHSGHRRQSGLAPALQAALRQPLHRLRFRSGHWQWRPCLPHQCPCCAGRPIHLFSSTLSCLWSFMVFGFGNAEASELRCGVIQTTLGPSDFVRYQNVHFLTNQTEWMSLARGPQTEW